jgi:ubiquinone/menaquinone biosynthesis C-methylase UbiE
MTDTSRFDQAASQWDANPSRVAVARAVGEAICRAVPIQPQWRALDFGAGTGLVTLRLQPLVASITAVDTSSGMLETLSKKLDSARIQNVSVRQWDIQEAMFPENGFDLCFSSMTLHHLRDVPLALARFRQLLKPGGWLAVADLDAEDGSFHGPNNDVFHNGFQRGEFRQWLETAGFKHATFSDAHSISKPNASGQTRSYSVFLCVAQSPE